MPIPFTKASACGNDFLLIEASEAKGDLAAITRRICDRHNGVGADGVEWLMPDAECDVRIRLINSDGSEAEISGNGTRCVAAHLVERTGKETVRIRTDAGVKVCTLIGRAGARFDFETEMGRPEIREPFTVKLQWAEVTGTPVSTGNPHFVRFVEEFPKTWKTEGAAIGGLTSIFPHGINVEFVRVVGPNAIEVRFFERGAGETQSSGTGSCASAVASIASGRVQSPLEVRAEGGTQVVRWDGEIYLRGPAQLVCRGEWFG